MKNNYIFLKSIVIILGLLIFLGLCLIIIKIVFDLIKDLKFKFLLQLIINNNKTIFML